MVVVVLMVPLLAVVYVRVSVSSLWTDEQDGAPSGGKQATERKKHVPNRLWCRRSTWRLRPRRCLLPTAWCRERWGLRLAAAPAASALGYHYQQYPLNAQREYPPAEAVVSLRLASVAIVARL